MLQYPRTTQVAQKHPLQKICDNNHQRKIFEWSGISQTLLKQGLSRILCHEYLRRERILQADCILYQLRYAAYDPLFSFRHRSIYRQKRMLFLHFESR